MIVRTSPTNIGHIFPGHFDLLLDQWLNGIDNQNLVLETWI